MPSERFNNRGIVTLDTELYQELLEKRGLYNISHFSTPAFNFDISGQIPFEVEERTWKSGDRLYKLSQEYYNTTQYWWVIGFINQKPTDSHYQTGDKILIPKPLEAVLTYIGVI